MSTLALALRINGEVHEITTEPHRTLLDVLRADLGLTGTKENCLEAECGVCTVLVGGVAVNSCILLAAECAGREVVTIEGLGRHDRLDPARAYLDENPAPTEAQVREALAGNLCRCTGYQKIADAVLAAAQVMSTNAGPS